MTPAVVAEKLVLSYGRNEALAESTFEIPAGRVTALIGPNGSGKSTLLNAIAGLKPPSAGRLTVLGGDPQSARRRIAYVPQSVKVNEAMPVTVREVVAMGRYAALGTLGWFGSADRATVQAAMSRLEIDHLSGRHLRDLSGGERQRVFVAQGLAQDHELLLLDEPFTALDLVSARTIEAVIAEERAAGGTVITSTHDLADAQAADWVLLLSRRVVAFGPPGSVLTVEHMTEAYGTRFVELEDGRFFIDDPAHRPAAARHVHLDRSIHVEPPGSDLHEGGGREGPTASG